MAFCNNIDTQMKQLWNGLVGTWRSYFHSTQDQDELTKMYQQMKENIQAKEEFIDNDVNVTKMYFEHFEEPQKLRQYIEDKMESDYFYKPYTIARALNHG